MSDNCRIVFYTFLICPSCWYVVNIARTFDWETTYIMSSSTLKSDCKTICSESYLAINDKMLVFTLVKSCRVNANKSKLKFLFFLYISSRIISKRENILLSVKLTHLMQKRLEATGNRVLCVPFVQNNFAEFYKI